MKIILPKSHALYTKSEEVKQICLPLRRHFEIQHFSYVRIHADLSRSHLTTSPQWSEHFYKHAYQYHQEEEGAIFGPTQEGYLTLSAPSSKQSVSDAAHYDIGHSLVFFKKEEEHTDLYFMALSHHTAHHALNYEKLLCNRDLLNAFTAYFKQVAAPLIQLSSQQKIVLPFLNPLNKETPVIHNDVLIRTAFLNAIQSKLYGFTPKEKECLRLLLNGHCPKHIARTMGISPKTLEKHLRALRDKTGTSHNIQLLSLIQNYFNPNSG